MAKGYREELAEWVKKRGSTQRDRNVVAFLAVHDDVKLALEAGYAVKTVWANLTESMRIGFGYDTFLNYVNRLIRRPPGNLGATPTPPETPAASVNAGAKKTATNSKQSNPPSGFTFNPIPNKKDLL